jgi:hypothetical protein
MEGDEVPIPQQLRDAYAAAIVRIDRDDHRLTVTPAAAGTAAGPFPEDAETVHIVTAWNPRSEPLAPHVNAARQRRLRAVAMTLPTGWIAGSEGHDAARSWVEDSLAIADAAEADVLELARRFDQHAVYAWTREARTTVWVADGRRDVAGWTCAREPRWPGPGVA